MCCDDGLYGNSFNPRPPYEGRPSAPRFPIIIDCFNPRPHTRGDAKDCAVNHTKLFQSTPPYEGRLCPFPLTGAEFVSIHVPHTRGDILPIG